MSPGNQYNIHAILSGSKFFKPGDLYRFTLQLFQISPLVSVNEIDLVVGESIICSWRCLANLPYILEGCARLPNFFNVWLPRFFLKGRDMIGRNRDLELRFDNLVLTTTACAPIYDTRLACSNWSSDQWKIDPVRNFLRVWGFDPYSRPRIDRFIAFWMWFELE
jgi:hypothetical protein